MGIISKTRKFFIRENAGSRSEFKRLILTFNLAIICMAVSIVYASFDLASGIFYSLPAYALLFTMPVLSLFLIRQRANTAAKMVLMLTANLVVFWMAVNDPFETGVFLLFIPAGIGSFAMLGFTESKLGVLLSMLTAILFLLAYTVDFSPLNLARPSDLYISISFIFNYFISLTISVLIVYFQMNLNRQSENELIQKEIFASQKNTELQKVNEELDRFVYSVSHDLRSPLSSILGLINIARLTKDNAELVGILNMIEGRVHSQDHFIREIIDYSRNARTETVTEPVFLKELAEEVILSLRHHGNAERISFRNDIPDDFEIMSDKIRLRIIFSNLVGNAIKYHDYSKQDPFVEIGVDLNAGHIYFRDNGSGMKPEHEHKIFNMFYRGSDRSTGSGLGLFITKEAVTKLGGSIKVRTVYGEGSTFLVHIPLTRAGSKQT